MTFSTWPFAGWRFCCMHWSISISEWFFFMFCFPKCFPQASSRYGRFCYSCVITLSAFKVFWSLIGKKLCRHVGLVCVLYSVWWSRSAVNIKPFFFLSPFFFQIFVWIFMTSEYSTVHCYFAFEILSQIFFVSRE